MCRSVSRSNPQKTDRFLRRPMNVPFTGALRRQSSRIASEHVVRFRTTSESIPFDQVSETRRFRTVPIEERFLWTTSQTNGILQCEPNTGLGTGR
jgi:hypothetical protein